MTGTMTSSPAICLCQGPNLATTMPCLQTTTTATRKLGITILSWGSEGQAPWLFVRMGSQVWGMYRHQGQPSHGAEW